MATDRRSSSPYTRTAPPAHRTQDGDRRPSQPGASEDFIPLAVIVACFLPVGVLVIASHGGGLPAAAAAFVVLVVITALLARLIGRAADEPAPDER